MNTKPDLAVLLSGGLDSAILLGWALRERTSVHPIFVRQGLSWEQAELDHVAKFLDAVRCPALCPLTILEQPVLDLYGSHWSVTGDGVPGADTPDEAVFLPGRNVLLLAKAALWCHLHGVGELGLGILGSNPFPDATPAFFDGLQDAINRAVEGNVRVVRPFAGMHKRDVMLLGKDLPLEWTFSCIRPRGGLHCGACNKCAERKQAFRDAGLADVTEYAPE